MMWRGSLPSVPVPRATGKKVETASFVMLNRAIAGMNPS